MAELARPMSPETYFDWVEAQDEKYEYYDGEVFSMAGGSDRHALIGANTTVAFTLALRPHGCAPYSSDMRIQLAASRRYVYPDFSAVCGEADFLDDRHYTLLNPTLVVEVLSPSTGDFDQGTKALWYRALPSLRALVLVAQDAPAVTVYTRDGDRWEVADVSGLDASFEALGERIALADLYLGMAFEAEPAEEA